MPDSGFRVTPAQPITRQPTAPRFQISPTRTLIDQPVDVRVVGLCPQEVITVEATTRDRTGAVWHSHVALSADSAGVAADSSMKLLWSMRPLDSRAQTPYFSPARETTALQIRALRDRSVFAAAELERLGQSPDVRVTDLSRHRDGLDARFFTPSVHPLTPAILQIGGAEGGRSDFPAAVLASYGFPSLSLAYFRAPGLPSTLRAIPLEYFAGALQWLAQQPEVDPRRIAVFGVSRGGEAALLTGAMFPDLVHAVIACTTSGRVFGANPRPGAAWTEAGTPVPFGPIPVERIRGPVLVTEGGKDGITLAPSAVARIVAQARAHSRTNIRGIAYPSAGHGVGWMLPNLPVAERIRTRPIGGTAAANARARASAWLHVLRFLRTLPSSEPKALTSDAADQLLT